MTIASMLTHTSILDFMNMTLKQFYRIYVAIGNVTEKKRRRRK